MKFKVEPDYPEGAILACMEISTPLMLADNVTCPCATCGTMLQHRPHVPASVFKLCLACVTRLAEARQASGKSTDMAVTQRALDEAMLFASKGRKQ